MSADFDYHCAFQRNLGFLSEDEQQRLRKARVAIAGLGGTGGAQAHALARMGIGNFTLADPDTYELANFNRQLGATMATLGQAKTRVARDIIHGINPEADIRCLDTGISPETIGEFLDGVDIVVDSLDFYCFEERFLLYAEARRRDLWVLTAPPLGFGFTLLIFDPRGMSFEEYFGFRPGMSQRELTVSLIAGIAPKPYMLKYLDSRRAELGNQRLPSVGAAPFMIAGVIATQVTNLLTGKRPLYAVPHVIQYDALLQRFRHRHYPLGMNSPLQKLKKLILHRVLPR
ncbi:ThiF family adenylyltransferase [Thiohalobacter sp. IOR34]|uniref:ThiF family adenylyltransferase n=1 Tax=Thiohalobacter sp. IOR34 TaxID=3057176 RepID=UPI0025AF2781|nr:ThiF family adenylyltransferase [Thiohalobacter sp. IOR34]WJW74472.1 ThiF family adenylyltransferase [Thiohalobacter sp. IOR34]